MNKRKRYMKRRLTKAHKRGTLINYRLDSIITPSYQVANYSEIIQLQKKINSLQKAVKNLSRRNN
ncbi:hypothetical protein K3F51_04135 [Limosilactobacillus reuteri]|uniref:hypothetical protein n=1 Tax=Limosilactobacillus reuteri TaxID=1598 RepID=UPI001CC11D06|nr:hypothetical protein [Limosilactobacillus reuteri]UAW61119.1 hypothetical protein K3F51_04135 [Limosilactobacillus reuteri]